MSLTDWKPTKRLGESDRDYRIRLREWENREDNRSRVFTSETGGSGSRTTTSSSSSSSSADGSCGCTMIILVTAAMLCYGLYVLLRDYTMPTIASIAVTGLFVWFIKLWITFCALANKKLKFFGSQFFENNLTLFIDRIRDDPEGEFEIKTKKILRDGIDYVFKPRFLILKILGHILYYTCCFILFLINYSLAGAITALVALGALAIPFIIYIPIIYWLYNTFG